MTAAGPAWSRLSVVPVNETHTLVIDRGNGKWIFTPGDNTPLVSLLNASAADLPAAVARRRDALAVELHDHGLGGPDYRTPPDLNTLILKLTKACNYACSYCYDLEPDDRIDHLPLETALEVIREGLELTPRRLGVILHGGEPTLLFHKLLRDLVVEGERMAEEMAKEILFIGQTNLSRLTDEMVDFFRRHQVHWGISLDGPPSLNDRFRVLRNGSGTYHYFDRALEKYPEFVRSCGVMSVITGQNDGMLLEIARHFRDVGISSWDWSLFYPIGQGRQNAERYQFDLDRLLEAWNDLFDAVEEGELDGMWIRPVTSYLENFFLGPGRNMCMKRDCGAGRDLLSVSADGSIHACDCIDPKGPHAHLGLVQIGASGSLARARDSEKARRIRSRDVTLGQCDTCPWLAVCGGTCMAHADDLHGVWEPQCRLAMLAFSRIAVSLAEGDDLRRYWRSLQPATSGAEAA